MSAACPACGVAVIPGYVRCPRCQAALPPPRRAASAGAGGTALADPRRGFPYLAAIATILAGAAIVLVVAVRRDHPPAAAGLETTAPHAAVVPPSAPTAPTAAEEPTPATPSRPDPSVPAGDLDRALKRQRLWGTVEVIGERVDVRSGGCGEPAMGAIIDTVIPQLRDAGLTRLRCMEQSGAVVFERDL